MRIIAVALIVAGALGLAYGVVNFKHREKVFDVGAIEVSRDKTERFEVSPWLGGTVLVVGVVLLGVTFRK